MARDTEEALNALDAWDATIADPQCDEDDALEAYEEVIGVASEPAQSADAVLSLAARVLTAHFAKFPHVHMNVIDVLLTLSTTAQSQSVRVHTIRSLTQIANAPAPLAPECVERIHTAVASLAGTETSGVVMRHLTALGKALNERRAASSAAVAPAPQSVRDPPVTPKPKPAPQPAPAPTPADTTPSTATATRPSEREAPAKAKTEQSVSPTRPAPQETTPAAPSRERERARPDDSERASRRTERPGRSRSPERPVQSRSSERAAAGAAHHEHPHRHARADSGRTLTEESERRKRIEERPFGMPANALYCPPCPYLFIGNVPINARQSELAAYFMAVDPHLLPAHVQVKFPTRVPPSTLHATGPRAPYGYAFVGMRTTELALDAIRYVRSHPFDGRTLTAYFARGPPCPTLAFVEHNRACASMEEDGAVRAIDFAREQRLWRRLCEMLRPFGAFDEVGAGKVRFRNIDSAKDVIRKHYLTVNGMEIIPIYEPEEQLRYDKTRTGDVESHFALKSGRIVGDRDSTHHGDRLRASSDADRHSRRGRSPSPAARRGRGRSPSRGRRSRSKSPEPARGRYGSRDMSMYGPGPGHRDADARRSLERSRPGPSDRFESSRSHGSSGSGGGGAMSRYGPALSERPSASSGGGARDERRPSDRAGSSRESRVSPPRQRYSTVTSTSRSRSPAAARRRSPSLYQRRRSPAAARRRSPSPYQRHRSRSPGRRVRSSRDDDRSLADIAREEAKRLGDDDRSIADIAREKAERLGEDRSLADIAREKAERLGEDRSIADIAREEAERFGDDRSIADIAREKAERLGNDRSLADIAREEAERLEPPVPSRRDGPPPPPPGHFLRYSDGKRPEHPPPPPPRGANSRAPRSRSRSPQSRPARVDEAREHSPVRSSTDHDGESAYRRHEHRESDGDRRGHRGRSPPRSAAATRYGPAPVERRRSRSNDNAASHARGRPDDREPQRAGRQERSRDAESPRDAHDSDDQNRRDRENRQERARSPPAKRGRSRSPVRRDGRSASREASSNRRVRSPGPKRSGPSRRSDSIDRVVEKKRRVESDDAAALDDMDEMMVDYEEDD